MGEFASEEGRVAKIDTLNILVVLKEDISDALDVVQLALAQAGEGFDCKGLAHFIHLIRRLVISIVKAILFAESVDSKCLLRHLIP